MTPIMKTILKMKTTPKNKDIPKNEEGLQNEDIHKKDDPQNKENPPQKYNLSELKTYLYPTSRLVETLYRDKLTDVKICVHRLRYKTINSL